ncbi:MAG: hypothetical protein RMJ59_03180 [Candidatus Nitrosocaldus sp.]|nr:hypothetical protein [Candidatus Nitrosocaldus sp.]MCS7140936.1 hypothetical protein [Candidatus Nitrosocaldus sp.]MDW7999987.1 hypothetical protein [Candidatus Nitrosocaldus sp.]MDW8275371.1 hypothetical protein [Candidatus Nitrosocaldus sp.]
MASGSAIAQELASAPFDEMIKNLLLAMVAAQNEANTSFIEGIKELADTIVEIKYKKRTGSGEEEKTISGNALAFGILPTMLQIQNGVIEVKMAITMERRTDFQLGVKAKAKFWFASVSVDAKYSNTYSYKAEASSYIRIQVAPAPPPQPLMKAIEKIAQDNPPQIPA